AKGLKELSALPARSSGGAEDDALLPGAFLAVSLHQVRAGLQRVGLHHRKNDGGQPVCAGAVEGERPEALAVLQSVELARVPLLDGANQIVSQERDGLTLLAATHLVVRKFQADECRLFGRLQCRLDRLGMENLRQKSHVDLLLTLSIATKASCNQIGQA